MSIYAETADEFRPRPSPFVLMLVSFLMIGLAFQTATILLGVVDSLWAWGSGWKEVVVLYFPFAGSPLSPFYSSPPLKASYEPVRLGLALIAFLLAILFVQFWPTEDRLSVRLFVHHLGLLLLVQGTAATAWEPGAYDSEAEAIGIPAIAWKIAAIALAGLGILYVERKTLRLFGNFESLESPVRRFASWALRLLPGLGLLIPLCMLNGWDAGAIGAAIGLTVSLAATLHSAPSMSYERVAHVRLLRSLPLVALLTILLVGGPVFVFGLPAAGMPHSVVSFGGPQGFLWEPNESLLRRQLRDRESLEKKRNTIRFRGEEAELPE